MASGQCPVGLALGDITFVNAGKRSYILWAKCESKWPDSATPLWHYSTVNSYQQDP